MYSKEVQVTNQVGLYARPATFFIQKANVVQVYHPGRKGRDAA